MSVRHVVGAALAALLLAAPGVAAERNVYTVHPLVSNVPGAAPTPDPNLVNAWGLVAGPTTPWWVADNGTNKSTLYTATGAIVPIVVDVDGAPTGIVFNGGAGFLVHSGALSGPARFIWASENGTLHGWNPVVPPPPSHPAQQTADRSAFGASYKGLAIAGSTLYATDFHNARVDMFDSAWSYVGSFTDASVPHGYAPFGIQAIGDRIFVTFAKQDADAGDEVAGQGRGLVDVFDTSGTLLARVAQHGQLNAPWGLALAPPSFGRFGGDLLVGNFGDGEILAYEELPNGHFEPRGELRGADGNPLAIDGLWALEFGNGNPSNGPTDTLFFTAGPNDEADGLFGSIVSG
jgi:uncharacterized protein (TIGR03118 family)